MNAPKKFLDNTQGNSTLTRQSFKPNNLPLSDMELQRMGEENGHVNAAADIDIEVEEKEEDSVWWCTGS